MGSFPEQRLVIEPSHISTEKQTARAKVWYARQEQISMRRDWDEKGRTGFRRYQNFALVFLTVELVEP